MYNKCKDKRGGFQMAYYDLTVTLDRPFLDTVAEYASSFDTSGLYIEDLSEIEDILGYSSNYDYIDESLIDSDKATAVIHIYPSDKDDADRMKEDLQRFCSEKSIPARVLLEEKEEEKWEESWQERYEKVVAGKFEVLPYWEEYSGQGLIPLRIDTSEAYGSGQSINTQLCLEAVSEIDLTGMKVLDMGTGTGILGIAALLSGAESVLGLDIDPFSIENSKENADNNGVGDRFDAVMRTSRTTDRLSTDFDAVFAHITADVIIDDGELYHSLLKEGGVFLGGGIISERKEEVTAELEKIGFRDFKYYECAEWVTLVCRRGEG